ncbi:MAG: hypothetical protein OEZ44_08615 [Candidatus Bathyarchaeota archaeon]|nr:hypothetical protein [Candidatus Bathyarchaeota archaeon]
MLPRGLTNEARYSLTPRLLEKAEDMIKDGTIAVTALTSSNVREYSYCALRLGFIRKISVVGIMAKMNEATCAFRSPQGGLPSTALVIRIPERAGEKGATNTRGIATRPIRPPEVNAGTNAITAHVMAYVRRKNINT